jgi:hypothetical protein
MINLKSEIQIKNIEREEIITLIIIMILLIKNEMKIIILK